MVVGQEQSHGMAILAAQPSAHEQLLEWQREALAAVQDGGGLVKGLHWNT